MTHITHLTPPELSTRWHSPVATLAYWRSRGDGPAYIKIGRRVLYALADIEAFEAKGKVLPI